MILDSLPIGFETLGRLIKLPMSKSLQWKMENNKNVFNSYVFKIVNIIK